MVSNAEQRSRGRRKLRAPESETAKGLRSSGTMPKAKRCVDQVRDGGRKRRQTMFDQGRGGRV